MRRRKQHPKQKRAARQGSADMREWRLTASKMTAEFLGTFLIVFMGCGSIMVMERFPGSLSPSVIPIIFGLAVAAMIYAVGHISGAHFNPSVTLAFALGRHFPLRYVAIYWLAQFGGAIAASAVLNAILPQGASYGATVSAVGTTVAVVWESLLTFFMMFVIIAVATDTRAVGTMAGAAIGAVITIEAFVAGPITGASMNPARSLAPALFQDQLGTWWVYALGPAIGATAAALVYNAIRQDQPHQRKEVT